MDNDKIEKLKTDDEIDLVDILAVIIKRKWTIIILLVLSFILSAAYVKLHISKSNNYTISITASLPEEYTIDTDYILSKQAPEMKFFIDELNQKINQYKLKNKYLNNASINQDSKNQIITIELTANSIDNTKKSALFVYKIYTNYKKTITDKNTKLFKVAQSSLDQELKQKQAIQDMLMKNLRNNSSSSINGALVYVVDFLSDDISNIKRIKTLNQEILLNQGKIEVSDGANKLILTDPTISQIDNFIKAETPSKKKTLLPIIVSVFLALFVGIFLAFVIEFFSREDVKTRLKEASKK